MKKNILIVAAAAAIMLSSCAEGGSNGTGSTTPSQETVTQQVSALPSKDVAAYGFTKESYPVIDGSTSAVPLDAGIYSSIFNIPQEEAEENITHTTTHKSFERLLNGEVDAIFTVPISAEQQKAADEKGITLESVPAAKEGFVFVVNANNPVESLTQQQIRDIYSGKITNWKEVGGNDAEIVPFQRNPDSGSQNYMTVFMDGYNLIDAKSEYMLYGMAGILDAIMNYDNGENAIGYSVYSYASEMYNNSNGIKFISVDNVKPSKESMASGEYPLLSCTYFVYSSTQPQDSPVRKLAEYISTEEGQQAVQNSGYVRAK